MKNRVWIKIVSWHVVKVDTDLTLCGRVAIGEVSETLPAGKSCETCLRIVARQDDGG